MDLWDLTKLLFRRWYVTLPMLLISMTGVLLVSQTVKSDYSAVGHLQMLPAPGSPNPDEVNLNPNPWDALGFGALGSAVIVKLQEPAVAEQLAAAGLSDSFSVSVEYGTTFFLIDVTAATPKQATDTVQRLMKMIAAEVAAVQARFNVKPEGLITTLELDQGESVTEVTSKFKRVLIVSAGIGFLLTTGITIAVDAWLRRRERRNPDADRADRAALDMMPTSGGPGRRIDPSPSSVSIATSPTLSKKAGEPRGGQYAMAAARGASAPLATDVSAEYLGTADEPEPADSHEASPDSTIVLPLQLSRSHNGGPENRHR